MNKAIQRIKNAALAQASPFEKKQKVVLDTDQDEEDVANLMIAAGFGDDLKTTTKKSRWCRWDVEGEGVKAEVKTRTYTKPEWDTWVIDTYKIDYMLEKFPEEETYFINVYEKEYHIYTCEYVASCNKVKKFARFRDGKSGLREYYEIPKNGFLMELKSKQKNEEK